MSADRTANAWSWGGTDMTPSRTTPELSAAEAAKVAEFDAAPEPPKIVVERVARAMWDEDGDPVRWVALAPDSYLRSRYRRLATAAVAAMGEVR